MHKNRWHCTDCGGVSPETETPYTLISSRYGWRVLFITQDGQRIPQWRCPDCWQLYKKRRDTPAAGTLEA